MFGGAPRSAVFLDRDGTLVDELGFLDDPDQVKLYPETGDAIRRLNEAGFFVALVTNQSGVARGLFDEKRLSAIHTRLQQLLVRSGARIDAIAYCPHHPEEGVPPYRRECICRKPKPGLILKLLQEHRLDPATSWVVGDSARDIEAGANAGLGGRILVATGKGQSEHRALPAELRPSIEWVEDLPTAVDVILETALQGR